MSESKISDSLEIRFNGVVSFAFSYKGNTLLTDPFVSNPPAKNVLFGKIRPDSVLIAKYFSEEILMQTKMTVIGHAHYDHLLDLPPLLKLIPSEAKICGSNTTKHILAAVQPRQQLIACNDIAGTVNTFGTWIYSADSSMRAMPLLNGHPPHFMGITLYAGSYKEDLNEIPLKTKKWKCGQPLSYVVDFLENEKPVFRLFYQSSAAHDDLGLFPESLLKEKSVDVAVLSIAVKGKKIDYQLNALEYVKPKITFLAHWDKFIGELNHEKPKGVPKAKVDDIYKIVSEKFKNEMHTILPLPGSVFTVVPD